MTESRNALIRRMYHDERCNVGEIAGYLKIYPADVRWALFGATASRTKARMRRFTRWTIHSPTESGPLTWSLGLQVRA